MALIEDGNRYLRSIITLTNLGDVGVAEKKLIELESFIKGTLPGLLRQDLHDLLLIKEADVECSGYLHLRQFLGNSRIWKILARRFVRRTGKYIDLLIFRRAIPKLAIELKLGYTKIPNKDAISLEKALTHLRVNKAYWISVIPRRQSDLRSKPLIKHVTHYTIVGLNKEMSDQDIAEWKKNRRRYMGDMRVGKGKARKHA